MTTSLSKGSKTPETLFEASIPLAYHVTNRFVPNYPYLKDDLTQVALIGLWKASKFFDPSKGVTFATFAIKCITNEILMALRQVRKTSNEVSLEIAVAQDTRGDELSLEDILPVYDSYFDPTPQLIESLTEDFCQQLTTQSANAIRHYLALALKGTPITQRALSEYSGISQPHISRLMIRWKEDLKRKLTQLTLEEA